MLREGKVVSERSGAISEAELRRWLCADVDRAGELPLCSSSTFLGS
jgi:hypothetical protein